MNKICRHCGKQIRQKGESWSVINKELKGAGSGLCTPVGKFGTGWFNLHKPVDEAGDVQKILNHYEV